MEASPCPLAMRHSNASADQAGSVQAASAARRSASRLE
jgi:hypothetical protein